jgi:hypothetical protein
MKINVGTDISVGILKLLDIFPSARMGLLSVTDGDWRYRFMRLIPWMREE